MPQPTKRSLSQTHRSSTAQYWPSNVTGTGNNMTRLGLEHRVSRLPCKHSTTELPSHMPTGYISPQLRYIYVLNLLGTMPEPTRQSLSGCCSQPEHGLTLAIICHRGGKRTWPDQDSNQSTTELPSHTADRLHFPLLY